MSKQYNVLFNISRMIDESKTKEVDVPTSFGEDLKRCIIKMNEKSYKPSPTYKPSNMSCLRNMYYQRVGADVDKSPISVDGIGVSESGTSRHLHIQRYISKMKDYDIDCEFVNVSKYIEDNNILDIEVRGSTEFECRLHNSKYNMSFMLDGIIKYKGTYYILEIKTESGFKWNSRQGVDPSHYNQAYAYALNLGITKVLFIYENRDTCLKKYYILDVSQQDMDSIKNKIDSCEAYVQTNIVPDKPQDLPNKVCTYCNYRTRCRIDKGVVSKSESTK